MLSLLILGFYAKPFNKYQNRKIPKSAIPIPLVLDDNTARVIFINAISVACIKTIRYVIQQ